MRTMKFLLLAGALLAGAAQAAPIPFEVFIRLHKGMQEAEVLAKAGAPDVTSDGAQTRSQSNNGTVTVSASRVLTWQAGGDVPYTTTVTLQNGVVTDIKRSKKL
ncbi:DUF2845 domain-containing protein [Chromobacterium sp. IIBBL 290-4]|uniref:DUF2845 domain-containing protein n=1 Tax=Chromobacterium sp. IIBBL 290-4 TaxID=2953890 RepID=UPI0020B863DD|nr:DUF2845 domain-containing protein [Chromobacterium sp. IIBBL 290-4]UTH72454.1 DUF2845 domain-containing protein [Chromobacterium sp. IIBBL 290-4]